MEEVYVTTAGQVLRKKGGDWYYGGRRWPFREVDRFVKLFGGGKMDRIEKVSDSFAQIALHNEQQLLQRMN